MSHHARSRRVPSSARAALLGLLLVATFALASRIVIANLAPTDARSGMALAWPIDATPAPASSEAVVEGRVVERRFGSPAPLEGVRLLAWMEGAPCQRSVLSDEQGRFRLRCGPFSGATRELQLLARSDAYEPWDLTLDAAGRLRLDPELQPRPTGQPSPTPDLDTWTDLLFAGRVVDAEDDRPVRHARAYVEPPLEDCLSPGWTDREGRFEVYCRWFQAFPQVHARVEARGYETEVFDAWKLFASDEPIRLTRGPGWTAPRVWLPRLSR